MAFFDDFSKKVSKAAQVAAKKSGDLVEITKLNAHISSTEDSIRANYRKMGEICYKLFSENTELSPDITALCKEIVDYQAQIEDLKAKITAIKNEDHEKADPIKSAADNTATVQAESAPQQAETAAQPSADQSSQGVNLDK